MNISLERKKCQVNPLKMTLRLPRGFCERHRESFVSGHMCHVQASLKDIASSIPDHDQKRISKYTMFSKSIHLPANDNISFFMAA
jgi:hypothetical protein